MFLKHLEAKFKNLDRIELTSDLTLQLFSSLNNDLFFFVVPGVGCEIQCVQETKWTDQICLLRFAGQKQISNLK